jgi:hypothetical protein
MVLGDLMWPRNIRTHLMFLGLTNVHKLYTLIFKLRNIFSVINIGPRNIKKTNKRMPFSYMPVPYREYINGLTNKLFIQTSETRSSHITWRRRDAFHDLVAIGYTL